MNFLDSVRQAAEKAAQATVVKEVPPNLKNLTGVITYAAVKETKAGLPRLNFRLVVDSGEHAGSGVWGGLGLRFDNDTNLAIVVESLMAFGVDPVELFASVPEGDLVAAHEAMAAAISGHRCVFSTGPADEQWGVQPRFFKPVRESTPAATYLPKVSVPMHDSRGGGQAGGAKVAPKRPAL